MCIVEPKLKQTLSEYAIYGALNFNSDPPDN